MSQSPIELKGSNFTLSVVHLHDSQPEIVRQALQEKVDKAPTFLKNAPVVINIAALDHIPDWKQLIAAILKTELHVVGISGCKDEQQKQAIIQAGLPLLNGGKELAAPSIEPENTATIKTQLVNTPVRSGQQIYARNCDLIVTKNVSAGAELIADGNIHIYGTLRGKVLAGASGDTSSQIFCTHLEAELISIAGQYWLSDQIPANFYRQAAKLSLENNMLTIQPLN